MSTSHVQSFASSSPEYLQAFEIFLRHTDQKVKALGWLKDLIERAPRHEGFIDAGAGNGQLTRWVADWFQTVVAIEPNPVLCQELQSQCPGAKAICSSIMEAEPDIQADMVLCSHVFYHVPQEDWETHLAKMVSWLAPAGQLVIGLQNPRSDCMQMLRYFLHDSFDLSELRDTAARLKIDGLQVSLETVSANIQADDLSTASDVAEFILNVLPMPNPPRRQDLERYVQQHFWRGEQYSYSCDQDFLVIKRVG